MNYFFKNIRETMKKVNDFQEISILLKSSCIRLISYQSLR